MDQTKEINPISRNIIGGHRGLDVFRLTFEDYSIIEKRANHDKVNSGPDFGKDLYDHNCLAVQNETRMLEAMEGSKFTPMVLSSGDDFVVQTDAGDEMGRKLLVSMLVAASPRSQAV